MIHQAPKGNHNVLILHSDEIGWAVVRAALEKRSDIRTIGQVRVRSDARWHACNHKIDLLLASEQIEGASSYPALAELRSGVCQECRIALFTNQVEPDELERFGQLELAGCCRWDELTSTEVIGAVLEALLVDDLLIGTRKIARDYFYIARGTTYEAHRAAQLTAIDHQILTLLAEGWTAKEIAQRANRSPKTVNNRLSELRARLGARNGPHLVHLAHQLCLITQSVDKSLG